MTQRATLGTVVRAARHAAGLTGRELAPMVGTHYSVLSRIENGQVTHPSAEVVQRLADALNLDPVELLGFLGVRLPDTVTFLRHRYRLTPHDAASVAEQLETMITNLDSANEGRSTP